MPNVMPSALAAAKQNTISPGNVCVDNKGKLFVAINLYRTAVPGTSPEAWYGIGFDGKTVNADDCVFISDSVNTYMKETYGEDFAADVEVPAT